MGKTFNLLLFIFLVSVYSKNIYAKNNPVLSPSSLYFTENKGQLKDQFQNPRSDIQFSLQANGLNVFIGTGQLHYQFSHTGISKKKITSTGLGTSNEEAEELAEINTYRMDVTLVGANKNAVAVTSLPLRYYENYHLPGCPSSGIQVHTFKKITYKNVYQGIDWVIYTNGNKLEHEFVLAPGADASVIRLKYSGCTSLKIDGEGNIIAVTPMGVITEHAPVSRCTDGTSIVSKFRLQDGVLSYDINNVTGSLIIDPVVEWGTYYGPDTSSSPFYSITSDDSANIYLCGLTYSGTVNSIATTGSHQYTYNGNADAYLVKFDSAGNRLWGTYYGGIGGDWGVGISCDNTGSVYMTGTTGSADSLNISTPGCQQRSYGGGLWDAFLVRFTAGGMLNWGTYIGGTGAEIPAAVACDKSGHVYISGRTNSNANIATPSGFSPAKNGGLDVFVAQYDSTGVKQWGTYYGGSMDDFGGVSCSDGFNVYLTGYTMNKTGIATPGSHQPIPSLGNDVFIAKFDVGGTRLWATFYGGTGEETNSAVTADDAGDLYLLGSTSSDTGIASAGCFQPTRAGGITDAFLAKFDKVTGMRVWGTYYGGPDEENTAICNVTARAGNVLITGYTKSTSGISSGSVWQPAYGGGDEDGFLAAFDANGAEKWSTYVGGSGTDDGRGTTSDGTAIYLCGQTNSTNNIGTAGQLLPTGGGAGTGFYYQGFLLKIIDPGPLYSVPDPHSGTEMLSIYPSPNNGVFKIAGTVGNYHGKAQVTMTDIAGRPIMTDEILVNHGILTGEINLNTVTPAGLYFLKIAMPGHTHMLKFVKY